MIIVIFRKAAAVDVESFVEFKTLVAKVVSREPDKPIIMYVDQKEILTMKPKV
jgi:predicted sulfurtransferase